MVDDARAQHRASDNPSEPVVSNVEIPAGGIDEATGKTILEAIGIATPQRALCSDRSAAHAAFARFGKPVVVKVIDASILHKTDVGGVHVNIRTSEELELALDRVDAISGPKRPYLIEVMAPAGLEFIVGAVRDPSFGPVVLVGLGGIAAEALQDVSRRLAPINRREAHEMLDELRGRALLDGWRGQPKVSRAAIIHALLAVSNLIARHDSVAEIEINPLRACADHALALDALIVVRNGPGNHLEEE
jgi:acetyltransferase